jgi:Raf kinase inhibitor-like YbhB/YbcL family protein
VSLSIVGRLLRGVRAGERHLSWNHPAMRGAPETLGLESANFANGEHMPVRCGGQGVGDNVSPALTWSGVPAAARELLLTLEDETAPLPRPVVHLVALGIDPSHPGFFESALTQGPDAPVRFGVGSFGRIGYYGPRPVPGHGPHRYVFQLFALDRKLEFDHPPKLTEILERATGHVLARGRLVGLFER